MFTNDGELCMTNISILVSGGGSNMQAIIDGISAGKIENARVALVISSSTTAYAIERADRAGIPVEVISSKNVPDEDEREKRLLGALKEANTDFILLAGYMKILPSSIVNEYKDRILNIHPSLIPKHCGKGYYGKIVHQSVLDAGDTESGATVHFVDEGVDTGRIIIQKKVPVLDGDTVEMLADRVLDVEHEIIVEAVNEVVNKKRG